MMKTNQIICGDCIEELKKLEENSVDAIITDPPYGLEFMGKDWDKFGVSPARAKRLLGEDNVGTGDKFFDYRDGAGKRGRYTEMDLKEKNSFQEFIRQFSVECLRVLKPGGFLLSFGGTRTYHRMTCGIEDAGFEIRDTIMWLYGSGFPKSLNIGKQIDKRKDWKKYEEFSNKLKEKREELNLTKQQAFIKCNFKAKTFGGNSWFEHGRIPLKDDYKLLKEGLNLDSTFDILFEEVEREFIKKDKNWGEKGSIPLTGYKEFEVTKGSSEWEGWGTALKPACEPIVVARKPLSEKNVALNVLKHGTGGINIDECRIGNEMIPCSNDIRSLQKWKEQDGRTHKELVNPEPTFNQGRFPANIILDEEAGKMLDEQSGEIISKKGKERFSTNTEMFGGGHTGEWNEYSDKGGASRFFYCAKASKSERNFGCEGLEEQKQDLSRKEGNPGGDNPRNRGVHKRTNNHPTVKPIKLMEYLIKLISREGAIILDPFIGSGTTAIACLKLNRKFIGIEKEEEYVKIAEARIKPFLEQEKLK